MLRLCIVFALLYTDLEYYEKAKPLFLKAKEIWEKLFGKQHPKYARVLHSLAKLSWKTGAYQQAESLYVESKNIWEKTLGKEHPDYSLNLIGLAILYTKLNQHEKVGRLYEGIVC